MIAYRKEIDGLRTLAVVPVIAFHAGFGLLPGGFVGVDIFFVISGYLITLILLREIGAGEFSIARFYERRARRILPALMVMLLACIPFAWAWMMALDLKDFFQSLAAAALSVSNFLFWREADYFAASAEMKPLLHTWSLGVEEQFYIFFPPLLLWLSRAGERWRLAVSGLLMAASLVASQALLHSDAMAVFYLLPFRAWELFAGSACAWLHFTFGRRENGWAAAAGIALILAVLPFYDHATPFPGLTAIPPVAGAALVILFAGPGNRAGRFLSLRPMVFVGLISYSLYLWHQPVFAFARHYSLDTPSPVLMAALVGLTFVLAWLSWRHVEQPFRHGGAGRLVPRRGAVFALSLVAILALGAIGGFGHLRNGFPGRYTPEQNRLLAENVWSKTCLRTRLDPLPGLPDAGCTFAPPAGMPDRGRIALVGDSVMASLSPALIARLTAEGYTVEQFTHSFCFLSRRYRYDNQDAAPCAGFMSQVLDRLESQPYALIIQLSNYHQYLQGDRYPLFDSQAGRRATLEETIADIRATAASLSGRLVFLRLYPLAPGAVTFRMVKELRTIGALSDQPYDPAASERGEVARRIDALMQGFWQISLARAFCEADGCHYVQDGRPMLYDMLHMSPPGASRVAAALLPELDAVTRGRGGLQND